MRSPRPLWRWWLFCAALHLFFRTGWRPLASLCAWCVVAEWLGRGNDCSEGTGEVPF